MVNISINLYFTIVNAYVGKVKKIFLWAQIQILDNACLVKVEICIPLS